MRPLAFCIPGDIDLPTGGYRYDREMLARLPAHGVPAVHVPLGPGFPHPSDADIARASAALSAVDVGALVMIDGLALGALPPQALAALPHRKVALVHHPLGLEAGLADERARFLLANEAAVLAKMRHVVVTSDATKRILVNDMSVSAHAISVVEPGTERRVRARGSGTPVQVLAVGAVSARKAYEVLIEALASVVDAPWRLTIAGSLSLDPEATTALRGAIARLGLGDRVNLAGALGEAELTRCYDTADLFAASSLFEGYGMALAEALAHGLPIVTSSGGAASQTVPDAAAIKVPPGDRAALASALRRVIADAGLRRRMADAAWAAAALLPTWDDAAAEMAERLRAL